MSIIPENNSQKREWPWWRIAATTLSILALALSLMMSWHYLTGSAMAGCDGGSPCNQVMSSKWSSIAGLLPVSGLAVGIYLALIIASFYIGTKTETAVRKLAWQVMLILAGAIAGSAIWFTILQKWFIGEFCPYCMAAHTIGFLLAILVIWKAFAEYGKQSGSEEKQETENKDINEHLAKQTHGRLRLLLLPLMGIALAGILAVSQVTLNPSANYRTGESQENKAGIDYKSAPFVGSHDAPYIINLLFDYKCQHCQRIHFMLDEVVQRYNGKVAFALCPTPLNPHCNPYIPQEAEAFKNSCELARIGLAVWVANRELFYTFENWMFTYESGERWRPRTLEVTQAKAIELIGQTKLDAAMSSAWIDSYLKTCIEMYGQSLKSGKGGVPRLILGSKWVVPQAYDVDELMSIIQESLGIPKP